MQGSGGSGRRAGTDGVRNREAPPRRGKTGGFRHGSGVRTSAGVLALIVLLFLSGTGDASWSTWFPAPPATSFEKAGTIYSYGNTQPRLAVDDDEFVHLAFVNDDLAATYPSNIYYNLRTTVGPGGTWGSVQPLSTIPPGSGRAALPDIDVWRDTAIGRTVYVVWEQYSNAAPLLGVIYLRVSETGGTSWPTAPIQVSNPLDASYQPSLAVDEDYVYIVWATVYQQLGMRIAFAVYSRTDLHLGLNTPRCTNVLFPDQTVFQDLHPRIVVDKTAAGHVKNVVFSRQALGSAEVYWTRSPNAECNGWTAAQRLSADDGFDSVNPDIAHSSARYLHLAWEDSGGGGPSQIRYRQNPDLGRKSVV